MRVTGIEICRVGAALRMESVTRLILKCQYKIMCVMQTANVRRRHAAPCYLFMQIAQKSALPGGMHATSIE